MTPLARLQSHLSGSAGWVTVTDAADKAEVRRGDWRVRLEELPPRLPSEDASWRAYVFWRVAPHQDYASECISWCPDGAITRSISSMRQLVDDVLAASPWGGAA